MNKCKVIQWLAILIGVSWLLWIQRYSVMHSMKYIIFEEYRSCVKLRHRYEVKDETSPLYVTLAHHGRLGNWLYAYASLLGIARTNGYIPYLDKYHPLGFVFKLTKLRSREAECLLSVNDPLPCGYVKDFNNLPAANISIDGYIQSWKYFHFMEDEIRKEFTFLDEIYHETKDRFLHYVSKYLKEGRVVISVHVRRGDKLFPGFQSLGFRPAPLDYFKNAMNYMASRFPKSVFLVLSDDMEWCRENISPVVIEYLDEDWKYMDGHFRIAGDTKQTISGIETVGRNNVLSEKIPIVFTGMNSRSVDLCMLTMANHSIISVGTFGWWGAWLANGQVAYYKDHLIPASTVDSQTVAADFFPPHWVPISSADKRSVNIFFLCLLISCTVLFS